MDTSKIYGQLSSSDLESLFAVIPSAFKQFTDPIVSSFSDVNWAAIYGQTLSDSAAALERALLPHIQRSLATDPSTRELLDHVSKIRKHSAQTTQSTSLSTDRKISFSRQDLLSLLAIIVTIILWLIDQRSCQQETELMETHNRLLERQIAIEEQQTEEIVKYQETLSLAITAMDDLTEQLKALHNDSDDIPLLTNEDACLFCDGSEILHRFPEEIHLPEQPPQE